jgi:hypothetical protein
MSNNIRTAGSVTINPDGSPLYANGYYYFCVGSTRYTYSTHPDNGQQVANTANPSASNQIYSGGTGGTFGLLKDKMVGNGCAAPCFPAASCIAEQMALSNSSVEMLGDNMRLASIIISNTNAAQNLYNINMVMAYGDDSVLNFSAAAPYATCIGNSANQAFCSVVTTSTTVLKGSQT